jgi:hypothetical protein
MPVIWLTLTATTPHRPQLELRTFIHGRLSAECSLSLKKEQLPVSFAHTSICASPMERVRKCKEELHAFIPDRSSSLQDILSL